MERRYGFTSEQACGHTSHTLLRTVFPQTLEEIEAALRYHNTWRGGVIHRHADGRAVVTVSHWQMHRGFDNTSALITEMHSNIAADCGGACGDFADVLVALTRELDANLAAISTCVGGVQRTLQAGWPDLNSVRAAMIQASGQIDRGIDGVSCLRHLAASMGESGETPLAGASGLPIALAINGQVTGGERSASVE
jgi:hypothetical protein